MEDLKDLLMDDLELKARVGPEGLYLLDGDMTMIVTDWKQSKFWSKIGNGVRNNQGETEGVFVNSVIQGTPETVSQFPGAEYLDGKIRDLFAESDTDLMDQYHNESVLIRCTSEGDFVIFNYKGQEIGIQTCYVDLLVELDAKLMPSEDPEYVSFVSGSGTIGLLKNIEVLFELDEGSGESLEECVSTLDEFEELYAKARKHPAFRTNDKLLGEVKQDFIDTLFRISGYENHGDRDFCNRVKELTEELFPTLTLRRGIAFPIKGRKYFESVSQERLSHLEVDDDNWSIFVSQWERGYDDRTGTYYPITREIANFLKKEVPTLEVRKS